ncbi:MAG: hypothetical protein JRK53_15220 [Deltaproteobacteria bacterium]|nr:hypothetical protein [Deltaproteobacteria bacterium]MBW1819111.1 hypothetical protein [Deltaproteobacteria bacterium]
MTPIRGLFILAGFPLLFLLSTGCASQKKEPAPVLSSESTCIQGTVWLQGPNSSYPTRYPRAKVTAWRHGTEEPLGEAVADERGNYCLQIPLAGYRADLRVWGLMNFRGKNYACRSEINNISLSGVSKRCGTGQECTRIDIMTVCEEFIPARRRN